MSERCAAVSTDLFAAQQLQKPLFNFEDMAFDEIGTAKRLHEYVASRLKKDQKNYLFFDEIQKVEDFQKAVDSLHLRKNVDICITGSNAMLLSGELATLISGRYVEVAMTPLSFKEYISAVGDAANLSRKYADYLRYSSFPYAFSHLYLQGISRSRLY